MVNKIIIMLFMFCSVAYAEIPYVSKADLADHGKIMETLNRIIGEVNRDMKEKADTTLTAHAYFTAAKCDYMIKQLSTMKSTTGTSTGTLEDTVTKFNKLLTNIESVAKVPQHPTAKAASIVE
jgi:hypothetical protein